MVVSYEEALEFAKNWKAPKCNDPDCICNIELNKRDDEDDGDDSSSGGPTKYLKGMRGY
jgi:hypothetical protein